MNFQSSNFEYAVLNSVRYEVKMKTILIILSLITLASCASTNVVKQQSLMPGDPSLENIVVQETYTFPARKSYGKLLINLKEGTYKPIGQNERGTFFVGPDNCMHYTRTDSNIDIGYNCGIFIKKEDKSWYIFQFGEELITGDKPYIPTLYSAFDEITEGIRDKYANSNYFVRPKPMEKEKLSYILSKE